jgi:hypothetical protein
MTDMLAGVDVVVVVAVDRLLDRCSLMVDEGFASVVFQPGSIPGDESETPDSNPPNDL